MTALLWILALALHGIALFLAMCAGWLVRGADAHGITRSREIIFAVCLCAAPLLTLAAIWVLP